MAEDTEAFEWIVEKKDNFAMSNPLKETDDVELNETYEIGCIVQK